MKITAKFQEKLNEILNKKTPCACGKTHEVTLKKIVFGVGAVDNLKDVIKELGDYKKVAMICDENTFLALGERVCKLYPISQTITLKKDSHANEIAVEQVESELQFADLLLAVGSGTVHDVTRYVAFLRKIPFISLPTAASVDGYVSSVAAMTWKGVKRTLTAVPPIAMLADSEVIANAPKRLNMSGVGDLLGKYTALFDWKVSNLLTGEYICQEIVKMEEDAIAELLQNLDGINKGEVTAIESLTFGLVLSGLAMQMVGNSRPASGAEHHISHLIEMGVLTSENYALHGEKVGVATALVLEKYHDAFKEKESEFKICDTKKLIEENFKNLSEEIYKENENEPLKNLRGDVLKDKWQDIQNLAKRTLPKAEDIREILKSVGASVSLVDIGVEENLKDRLLKLSPLVRNRLTFMRILSLMQN